MPPTVLTVLNVAYPLAPVGPDAVGGAEQILSYLDGALVRAGHTSLVVASADSKAAGLLLATPRIEGAFTEEARTYAHSRHKRAIEDALQRFPVDLVHMHGIDFFHYLPPPGVPVLATLHLPIAWYPAEVFRPKRPHTYLHCVSASQRAACPEGARLLADIPNGVPTDVLAARHAKRRFALVLARICPEKGVHLAIEAAAQAATPLLIAGEVFPYEAHERYFRDEVLSRLGPSCRFLGPVGLVRKRRLLSAARCLLVPSQAPETSSLVAMEALACGTPVVAYRVGALPEIVEHGRTGFLVADIAQMADAIRAAGDFEPEVCRAAARSRFSLDLMVERYFALYRELAARGQAVTERAAAGAA